MTARHPAQSQRQEAMVRRWRGCDGLCFQGGLTIGMSEHGEKIMNQPTGAGRASDDAVVLPLEVRGRIATDAEDAMAAMVNVAGNKWSRAKWEYDATPWWMILRKLRLRRHLQRKDTVFEVAMELYSEFRESR